MNIMSKIKETHKKLLVNQKLLVEQEEALAAKQAEFDKSLSEIHQSIRYILTIVRTVTRKERGTWRISTSDFTKSFRWFAAADGAFKITKLDENGVHIDYKAFTHERKPLSGIAYIKLSDLSLSDRNIAKAVRKSVRVMKQIESHERKIIKNSREIRPLEQKIDSLKASFKNATLNLVEKGFTDKKYNDLSDKHNKKISVLQDEVKSLKDDNETLKNDLYELQLMSCK